MKALIRKSPDTPTKPSQDEIYLQPWLDWIDQQTGAPLTDENYGYALSDDFAPTFTEEHPELTLDDFEITEHTETEGEGEEAVTRKYWTARYVGPTEIVP